MEGLKKLAKIVKIGDTLENFLKKKNLLKRVKEEQAINLWKEIVGEEISNKTEANVIKDGILFVSCYSSSWATELSFMKEQIIKKINKRLKENVVKDIYFRGG